MADPRRAGVVAPPDSRTVPSRGRAHRGSDVVALGLLGLAAVLLALRLTGGLSAVFGGVDLSGPLAPGSWMAWTWAVALFFGTIALLLVLMTLWQGLAPEPPRVGALRIETTPGDRLFVSLLGAAFIHLAWLGLVGPPLWGGLIVSLVCAAAVFRWA